MKLTNLLAFGAITTATGYATGYPCAGAFVVGTSLGLGAIDSLVRKAARCCFPSANPTPSSFQPQNEILNKHNIAKFALGSGFLIATAGCAVGLPILGTLTGVATSIFGATTQKVVTLATRQRGRPLTAELENKIIDRLGRAANNGENPLRSPGRATVINNFWESWENSKQVDLDQLGPNELGSILKGNYLRGEKLLTPLKFEEILEKALSSCKMSTPPRRKNGSQLMQWLLKDLKRTDQHRRDVAIKIALENLNQNMNKLPPRTQLRIERNLILCNEIAYHIPSIPAGAKSKLEGVFVACGINMYDSNRFPQDGNTKERMGLANEILSQFTHKIWLDSDGSFAMKSRSSQPIQKLSQEVNAEEITQIEINNLEKLLREKRGIANFELRTIH